VTEIEERLARLEGAVRYQSAFLRKSATRSAQREAAELEARLAPQLPGGPVGMRADTTRDPDLSSSLLDRLRNDAGMAYAVAGSGMSALGSGNLLRDPTLDSLETNQPLTTNWQDVGLYWQARYSVLSGDAPNEVILHWQPTRDFYSSARARFYLYWPLPTSVGEVIIELRTRGGNGSIPDLAWPWLMAAARMYVQQEEERAGTVFATVSIVEGDTVVVASDETDLASLAEIGMEGQPFVGLTDPLVALGTSANPDILVSMRVASDGSNELARTASVYVAEPVLGYQDEESPESFQPGIGRWNPIPVNPGVRVVREANQSIPNATMRTLTFPDGFRRVEYGLESEYISLSSGGGIWTPKAAGIVRVSPSVEFASNSSGSRQLRVIRMLSGTDPLIVRRKRLIATSGVMTLDFDVEFAVDLGDTIMLEVYQDSGGALSVLGDSTGNVSTSCEVRLVSWRGE
jgi:hypothetical protein